MFRNYLAAALRNLLRHPLYTVINVAGLAVGFAAALLIALFVRNELTYDRWMNGHENIYRVSSYTLTAGLKQSWDVAPRGATEALKQDFPEIEALAQVSCCEETVGLRRGDIEAMENIHWADSNIFDVLPLPAIAGDLRTALVQPDGVVITRALARKYFGTDAPLGQVIEVDRKFLMRVTAVLEDLPSDTHLDIGVIAPVAGIYSRVDPADMGRAMYTYLRLPPAINLERMQQSLPVFNERHPEFTQGRRALWLDGIIPIADIHLRPPTTTDMKPGGEPATVYSAMAIAILIVAVASINFVNLSTARAVRRAVEVGVRKVSGALRRQLIVQFIGESLVYASFGMFAAIGLAFFMLPAFNAFLQRSIEPDVGKGLVLSAVAAAIVMLVGIAAGAYPAFVLSRFSPAAVLKGVQHARRTGGKGRHILVAAQFALLIVLALVATVITQQVRYASTEALRLNTDQILVVNGGQQTACVPALTTAIQELPGVQGAACIAGPILGGPVLIMDVNAPGDATAKSQFLPVDFQTFDVYGLAPLAGRFFSPAYGNDSPPLDGKVDLGGSAVINQALARNLGFATPQDAIGKVIRFSPTIARTAAEKRPDGVTEIIGVVADFGANRDLRQDVPPRVFFIEPDFMYGHGSLHVRLSGHQIPETLAAIDGLWKQLGPPKPIERIFLNETIERMYREYARQGEVVAIFAAVAVFISCLGLFGLAAFTAEQRTKEIGIRKSMGATRIDILRLILWQFIKPVLWGSLIGWPASYLLTARWLENFADRIDVGLWMYPLASALALAIALLTVIGHALLVARAQPVKALRYE